MKKRREEPPAVFWAEMRRREKIVHDFANSPNRPFRPFGFQSAEAQAIYERMAIDSALKNTRDELWTEWRALGCPDTFRVGARK